jgi:hypothetical protein
MSPSCLRPSPRPNATPRAREAQLARALRRRASTFCGLIPRPSPPRKRRRPFQRAPTSFLHHPRKPQTDRSSAASSANFSARRMSSRLRPRFPPAPPEHPALQRRIGQFAHRECGSASAIRRAVQLRHRWFTLRTVSRRIERDPSASVRARASAAAPDRFLGGPRVVSLAHRT